MGRVREGDEGGVWERGNRRVENKITRLRFSKNCMQQLVALCYSLLSPAPLPPSPDSSMAPSRAMRMMRSTSNDVNFILGCPVTQGERDREALILPIATRHCCALIGI